MPSKSNKYHNRTVIRSKIAKKRSNLGSRRNISEKNAGHT